MHLPPVTRAVRNLTRRPAFTATAILLLALGAGANAAVFSVVRGVLLRPLEVHEPDRLVALGPNAFVSNEEIAYWRDRVHGFSQTAAVSPGWMMALVVDGVEPRKVTGGRTSDNFFRTLGVSAVVGRTIMPGDSAPGQNAVVVLSYSIYEQVFGANPRVIGRSVRLDNVVHEIIGVMPRGFEFLGARHGRVGATDVRRIIADAPRRLLRRVRPSPARRDCQGRHRRVAIVASGHARRPGEGRRLVS